MKPKKEGRMSAAPMARAGARDRALERKRTRDRLVPELERYIARSGRERLGAAGPGRKP
ncbi:MAG: hypothetical protein ACNS63_10845 [Candidatus Nitrospinota bacterium M3_3B_026]